MGPEIFVPFIVFASTVLVVWLFFGSSAKKREAELETVRSIVEKTGEASPELIAAIGRPRRVRNADLRKGLILIAIAAAFALFGQLIPSEEGFAGPLLGVALFPGLVGLVYVLFHFTGSSRDDDRTV